MMKQIGIPVQIVGETWYPIDKLWYDLWVKYTMFDRGDQDIPGGLDNLVNVCGPRPGKIDNSVLQGLFIIIPI